MGMQHGAHHPTRSVAGRITTAGERMPFKGPINGAKRCRRSDVRASHDPWLRAAIRPNRTGAWREPGQEWPAMGEIKWSAWSGNRASVSRGFRLLWSALSEATIHDLLESPGQGEYSLISGVVLSPVSCAASFRTHGSCSRPGSWDDAKATGITWYT